MTELNIIKYTHNDFLTDIDLLESKIVHYSKTVEPITMIVAISRGGLIPGVYLSHRLKLPLRVVEYSTRDGMVGETNYSWLSNLRNALIVDDIADSGRTLNYVVDVNPRLPTCVLIQKEMSDHNATIHARYDNGLDWFEFDWESH